MLDLWNFLSGISDEGTLVVAFWIAYKIGGIEKQLDSHIPTQMNKLEDSQKEMRTEIKEDQKEMKTEIKNEIKAQNQKIDQNYKDLTTQNNQNFKELVSLITKHRTG